MSLRILAVDGPLDKRAPGEPIMLGPAYLRGKHIECKRILPL